MTIRTRTLWTSVTATLVLALAFVTVSAQPPSGRGGRQGHMGPGPGGPMAMLRGLDLTDAQREQIRALAEEQRKDGPPMQKAGELRRELHAAIFADSPDHARIDQLEAAIAEAEATALSAHVEHQLKVAQVLTAEQRAKVRELPARGPGRRGARP